MLKKGLAIGMSAFLLASSLAPVSVQAASWKQNKTGWWWQEDNGSYPVSQWKPSAEDRKIVLQVPTALLDTVILSTTNEDVFLPVLAVTGSIDVSTNGGNITFENLDVGNTLTLTVKNGDISGTVAGSYDDFAIQSEIKKGDSNLPNNKESGKKMLNVTSNNGDINIEFLNK